ncbi:MAG: hypothetical protein CV081_03050 [Nitrospira sp. LK265]|nr:hypothetical protein [Nitrospira sp. LK265]
MKSPLYLSLGIVAAWTCGFACPSAAIEVQPAQAQVQLALDRGKEAAAHRQAPETFYVRFGSGDDLQPGGFLVTKLGGLSVMATHMALRGLEPSAADIALVTETSTMLVSAVILGDSPSFAVNSYVVLDQGGRIVKPVTVRVDGQAGRSSIWPKSPKFRAKVVASFSYADFDPNAQTTIIVFPASGGEVRFSLNFTDID